MNRLVFPITPKEAEKLGLTYSPENNRNAKFPARLRALRNEANISQAKLADQIGITKSTISLYENGDNVPDIKTLVKFADFYGVSFDYLLCRSDYKDANNQEIAEEFPLSERAMEVLRFLKESDNHHDKVTMINFLIETCHESSFLHDLHNYFFLKMYFADQEELSRIHSVTGDVSKYSGPVQRYADIKMIGISDDTHGKEHRSFIKIDKDDVQNIFYTKVLTSLLKTRELAKYFPIL